MFDNLKLEYMPDWMAVQASFDLPAGALDKLHDAICRNEVLRNGPFEHFDYDKGIWVNAEVKIGNDWVQIGASVEENKVWVSLPAKVYGEERLDYTNWNPHDVDGQWPDFIQPLKRIAEILQ